MEEECGFLKQSINGNRILHPQLTRKWDLATHGPAASTSAPSIGCLLLLGCGWTSTEFIFGFTLVTNSVGNIQVSDIGR
jgi:hypothetical protein